MQNVIIGENICFFLRKILTLARKKNYGIKERNIKNWYDKMGIDKSVILSQL